MKIFAVILLWIMIALILAAGLVMAVKGSPWLLILGFGGFCYGIAKVGCLTH